MRKKPFFTPIAIVAALFLSISAQRSGAETIPIQYFTLPPQIIDLALSPDGRHMAAIVLSEDRYILAIKDLDADNDQSSELFDLGPGLSFEWTRWASPDRLLAGFSIVIDRKDYTGVGTRILAVGPRGENQIVLGQDSGDQPPILFDDVIDVLPDQPMEILVNAVYETNGFSEARRVNIYTGRNDLVVPATKPVYRWLSDHSGRIRLGIGQTDTERYLYRLDADDLDVEEIWSASFSTRRVFAPIGFSADPDIVLVESNHEHGPSALYEFSISGRQFGRRIFGHPGVDISGATMDVAGRKLIGVSYVLDQTETYFLDSRAAALTKRIAGNLSERNVQLIDMNLGGNRAAVFAGADTDPGRYYIFDQTAGWLRQVGSVNDAIDHKSLAPMNPVSYRARDGLEISGYLTLPKGQDMDAAPFLPIVILPHGGPTARDWRRYDYQVQFLVNRGYGVFQMNFRGSSGFGFDFEKAGYGEWGQAMQDDITDGVYWLINRGIADPNRICIYGASYGGYAALMGAARTPDIFRCAVSLNGVSDLNQIVRYAKESVGPFGAMHIGHEIEDRNNLAANSPLKLAKEFGVPTLIVHGNRDRTVPIEHSVKMAEALRRHKKDVRFVILEGSGHSLLQQRHRNRFLTELEMFLNQHIGAGQPAR